MSLISNELILWSKTVKKALVDRGLSVSQLAKGIGSSRPHVSAVINGRLHSPKTQAHVSEYLGIYLPK